MHTHTQFKSKLEKTWKFHNDFRHKTEPTNNSYTEAMSEELKSEKTS